MAGRFAGGFSIAFCYTLEEKDFFELDFCSVLVLSSNSVQFWFRENSSSRFLVRNFSMFRVGCFGWLRGRKFLNFQLETENLEVLSIKLFGVASIWVQSDSICVQLEFECTWGRLPRLTGQLGCTPCGGGEAGGDSKRRIWLKLVWLIPRRLRPYRFGSERRRGCAWKVYQGILWLLRRAGSSIFFLCSLKGRPIAKKNPARFRVRFKRRKNASLLGWFAFSLFPFGVFHWISLMIGINKLFQQSFFYWDFSIVPRFVLRFASIWVEVWLGWEILSKKFCVNISVWFSAYPVGFRCASGFHGRPAMRSNTQTVRIVTDVPSTLPQSVSLQPTLV